MSKRYALLVGTVISALALSGCGHGQGNQGATSTQVANSVTSESVSSVSTSQSSRSQSSSQSASEAKSQGASQASQEPASSQAQPSYFKQMQAAYQKQLDYRDSLSEDARSSVQAPFTAAYQEGERLKGLHPQDSQRIEQESADFQHYLNWDKQAFASFFLKWAQGMKQDYRPLHLEDFVGIGDSSNRLKNATVHGKAVTWNIMGNVKNARYDYLILDSYETTDSDPSQRHLYLFTLHQGQPQVLYSQAHLADSDKLDFKETENQELSQGFAKYLNPDNRESVQASDEGTIAGPSDIRRDHIAQVMEAYGKAQGQTYQAATPATALSYYDLAVPDQVLNQAKVDGQAASFQFYGMQLGKSDLNYEVTAIYVRQDGKQVIAFVKRHNHAYILEATAQPDQEGQVSFQTTQNPDLMSAFD